MSLSLRLTVLGTALPALLLPVIAREFLPPTIDLVYWIVDVFLKVIVPILCLLLLYRIGVSPEMYGLRFTRSGYTWGEVVSISFICTLVFLASVIVFNIVENYVPEAGQMTRSQANALARGGGLAAVIYHALSAGVFEEIFFRGVLGVVFLKKRRVIDVGLYVAVSSFAFLGIHSISNIADIFTLLFFGCSAAVMYVLLRNLWPIIIAHTLYDLVILIWRSKLGLPT